MQIRIAMCRKASQQGMARFCSSDYGFLLETMLLQRYNYRGKQYNAARDFFAISVSNIIWQNYNLRLLIRKMNPVDKRISDFLDYLQLKNEYGQTLYGHLAQIIAKLLDDKPQNAVQAMTPISLEIKNAAGALGSSTQYESQLSDDEIKLVEHILSLYERRNGGLEGLEKQLPASSKVVKTNVIQLNNQLRLLNVPCLDSLTAQLLQTRINDFSESRQGYFSEVKFFGQFVSKNGTYYAIECLPIKPRKKMYRYRGSVLDFDAQNTPHNCKNLSAFVPEKNIAFLTERKVRKMQEYIASILAEIDPEGLEFDLTTINSPPKIVTQGVFPSGDGSHAEGVNKYIYFVTKNLTEIETLWTRLPDVEARYLRVSRFIRTRLTGDLDARVYDKIPPFPGVEAHYLRCLIARIKHGTALAPAACMQLPEEPDVEEEELDENQARELKAKEFLDPNTALDVFKDDVENDELHTKKAGKHLLTWPAIYTEAEDIYYEDLLSLDNWVHVCPVLSHHGVVLPFELPEQEEVEEPEPEEEEPEEAYNETNGDADEAEVEEEAHKNEEEEVKEPEEKPIDIEPLAKQRLETAYAESDQKRILTENSALVKETARYKVKFVAPAAHWQIVRDTWEYESKMNQGIYKTDRFFGLEMAPVDITCKQQELPEKEQAYWDKEQENEDKLKEKDEQFNEGDKLDPEREVLEIPRPEVMATASGDSEVIIHTNKLEQVSVQAETGKAPAYRIITNRLMYKNSPICVASQRWNGMMNLCYNHSNKDVITFASVYIGDGLYTPMLNNFDEVCFALPPPMCMPPADLLEEPDVIPEIEQEVFNRYGDAEQRDRDAIAKIRADREEKKRLKEERRKERELAKLRALEEKHEGEEEERPEAEQKEEEVKEPEPIVEEPPKQKGKKKAGK